MLVLSANVCTASAATSGSGNATICVQAQNTFWSRSVTIKQAPEFMEVSIIFNNFCEPATALVSGYFRILLKNSFYHIYSVKP